MNKELKKMLNSIIVEENWEKCCNIIKSLYTTLYINNIRYSYGDMTEKQLINYLEELHDKGCLIDADVTWQEFKDFMTRDIEEYFN